MTVVSHSPVDPGADCLHSLLVVSIARTPVNLITLPSGGIINSITPHDSPPRPFNPIILL